MRRTLVGLVAVLVVMASTIATGSRVEAGVPPSSCKNTDVPGAKMGHFPPDPKASSRLQLDCAFEPPMVSSAYTIHDFDVTQYHPGAARIVQNSVALGASVTSFTVSNCVGLTTWVNRPITHLSGTGGIGPGIGPDTFVKSISGACLVSLNKPTVAAIAAGSSFKIDNSSSRSITDLTTTTASTTATSTTANFTAADVGMVIAASPNLPADTTITAVVNATTISVSVPAVVTGTLYATIGEGVIGTQARTITTGTTTTSVRIVAAQARFQTSDVGLEVSGICFNGVGAGDDYTIPPNIFILTRINNTTVDTNGVLALSQADCTLTVGDPTVTAPQDGEDAAQHTFRVDIDPLSVLVGPDPCASNTRETVVFKAKWQNPGSFQSAPLAPQPASSRALAQLVFDTGGTVDLTGYVLERSALSVGDPVANSHYDVVFPFDPISTVMCATTTPLSFEIMVDPQTLSQGLILQGYGVPGTNRVRFIHYPSNGLIGPPTGYNYTSNIYLVSDTATTFTPATGFIRTCLYTSSGGAFQCA